ncbi:hypothetical protein PAJ34TS1_52070 [Paenibacillus azoreducens]
MSGCVGSEPSLRGGDNVSRFLCGCMMKPACNGAVTLGAFCYDCVGVKKEKDVHYNTSKEHAATEAETPSQNPPAAPVC